MAFRVVDLSFCWVPHNNGLALSRDLDNPVIVSVGAYRAIGGGFGIPAISPASSDSTTCRESHIVN